jgi:hypothetical protein
VVVNPFFIFLFLSNLSFDFCSSFFAVAHRFKKGLAFNVVNFLLGYVNWRWNRNRRFRVALCISRLNDFCWWNIYLFNRVCFWLGSSHLWLSRRSNFDLFGLFRCRSQLSLKLWDGLILLSSMLGDMFLNLMHLLLISCLPYPNSKFKIYIVKSTFLH